jgi:hypothetical protein
MILRNTWQQSHRSKNSIYWRDEVIVPNTIDSTEYRKAEPTIEWVSIDSTDSQNQRSHNCIPYVQVIMFELIPPSWFHDPEVDMQLLTISNYYTT